MNVPVYSFGQALIFRLTDGREGNGEILEVLDGWIYHVTFIDHDGEEKA